MQPAPQTPPPAHRPHRGAAPLRTSELILLATIAVFVVVAAIQAVVLVAADVATP